MSESEAASAQADLEALRRFGVDAQLLERIEFLSRSRFNIFEAIGFVGQEIKHSRFLAFLLDPGQRHGLDDHFLKGFLQKAWVHPDAESSPILPESLSKADLSQTRVQREHQYIDILLTNETHEFAVIIENKIGTTEHSDQLRRYYDLIKAKYRDWQVAGVYLTRHGDSPSHDAYRPLDYGTVCGIVDDLLENQGLPLSPDVKMAMKHYVQMVRRNIVDDPEVVNLARSMYTKHRRALHLINRYRPVPEKQILDSPDRLVRETEELIYLGRVGSSKLVFLPQEWKVPALDKGKHENDPFGFLRFVFQNDVNGLHLLLQTSPGDATTRRKLYEMGKRHDAVFNDLVDPDNSGFPTLYRRIFLTPEWSQNASEIEREEQIREQWTAFLDEDLPKMKEALKKEAWIWESEEPDEGRSSQGSRFV